MCKQSSLADQLVTKGLATADALSLPDSAVASISDAVPAKPVKKTPARKAPAKPKVSTKVKRAPKATPAVEPTEDEQTPACVVATVNSIAQAPQAIVSEKARPADYGVTKLLRIPAADIVFPAGARELNLGGERCLQAHMKVGPFMYVHLRVTGNIDGLDLRKPNIIGGEVLIVTKPADDGLRHLHVVIHRTSEKPKTTHHVRVYANKRSAKARGWVSRFYNECLCGVVDVIDIARSFGNSMKLAA